MSQQDNNNNNNNNQNNVPQTFEEFQELQKQQARPASQLQQTQYDDKGNAIFPSQDTIGQPNKSRGVIGVKQGNDAGVETNKQNKFYLGQPTQGTVADRVNSPINYKHIEYFNNTQEAMQRRIEAEKKAGTLPPEYQEQIEIKRRLEMQGARYTAPKQFEGLPGLEPTPEPKIDPALQDSNGDKISITDEQPPGTNIVEQLQQLEQGQGQGQQQQQVNPENVQVNPNQIKSGLDQMPQVQQQEDDNQTQTTEQNNQA